MTFLNPLLIAGIAGVAAPVLIHLLAKKRIQRVVWAAMKFLKVTVERNQRKMNLEDIILLLMRCAFLILLALALARPALRESGLPLLGGEETALILLDNSGSMSVTDGSLTRFEKARAAAEAVVDSLPGGSQVAVWLVSDVVNDVIPQPTRDLAMARKVIREARRGDLATDWQPALRRAVDVAQKHPSVHKHLYIISDAQAAGWRGTGETRAMLETVKKEIATRLILVGEGETRNIAVAGLRLGSALATVNQPLRFEVQAANFGPEPAANVAISLAVDDEPPSDEQTFESLPPGGEPKTLSLFVTVREPGFHTITARVLADRCTFDDTRTFALHVDDEIHVLLVDGDPGLEPRESEVFYLRNALTPVPAERLGEFFIKTKTIAPAELDTTPLRDFEVIMLANAVDLSGAAVQQLEEFVRAGGGLAVFPGGKISPQFYNDTLHARGLLPAAYGEPRGTLPAGAEKPAEFFALQPRDYAHRIVEPWRDPKAGSLATAQFYRAFTMVPARRSEVPGGLGQPGIVLSFADGAPAIIERDFGAGRVVQFAAPAGAKWSDLPVRPVFLPLMHRTLGHLLARQEDRLNVRAGSPFAYTLRPGSIAERFILVPPGGKRETAEPRHVEQRDGTRALASSDTALAGRYSAFFADDALPPLHFAAQADPAESSLAELSGTDLKTLEGVAQIVRWSPGMNLKATIQRSRTGAEVWLPFAIAALLVAVAEMWLGNLWSRSK